MITDEITKIKILHVIATMDPTHGGPIQGVRSYVAEFYRLSFKNEVICLDHPQEPFLKVDFILHAVGPCKRPWCYTRKLRPWLKQNLRRFDVVIVHGLWLYHGFAVTKEIEALKKLNNLPTTVPKVYVMPHGMLDPYFQKAAGRKLKAIRNIFYWRWIEALVINQADGLLFTCEEELLLARQTFGNYQPKNEYNILYGVAEPPAFTRQMQLALQRECPELSGRSYMLFLSRLHEKKGLDLLIQSYAQVYGSNTGQNNASDTSDSPMLVIAGPGLDTPYGENLQDLVAQLHLEDVVLFPGMLTGDTKWGAFYGCESFVLPSHQENFGIAVAEALACSKPVLISKQVNIWREINAGTAGLMEDDTFAGTKQLLSNWKQLDPGKKSRMKENARLCYENNFAIDRATLRMLSVFV